MTLAEKKKEVERRLEIVKTWPVDYPTAYKLLKDAEVTDENAADLYDMLVPNWGTK